MILKLFRVSWNEPARANKALILLKHGKWKEGWENYEWRRRLCIQGNNYPEMEKMIARPYWNEEENSEKRRLLVCGEQGIGDNIQFLRNFDF